MKRVLQLVAVLLAMSFATVAQDQVVHSLTTTGAGSGGATYAVNTGGGSTTLKAPASTTGNVPVTWQLPQTDAVGCFGSDGNGNSGTAAMSILQCLQTTGTLNNGDFLSINAAGKAVDSQVPVLAAYVFTTPTLGVGVNFQFTALGTTTEKLFGFKIDRAVTLSNMTWGVTGADNTANLYDIGIYNSAGTLVADIGTTAGTAFAPSVGTFSKAVNSGSSVTLYPGKYYEGLATNCSATCATLGGPASQFTFAVTTATTSGGALVSSFTPPSDSWTTTGSSNGTQVMPMFVLR